MVWSFCLDYVQMPEVILSHVHGARGKPVALQECIYALKKTVSLLFELSRGTCPSPILFRRGIVNLL